MIDLDFRDIFALVSVITTLAAVIWAYSQTAIRVKKINGMPERMAVVEAEIKEIRFQMGEHRKDSKTQSDKLFQLLSERK